MNKTKQKRVAVYARTSKDDGDGVSIEQQIAFAKEKANENGWAYVGEYVDKDVSGDYPPQQFATGKQKTRTALTRLINDIQAGLLDAIIIRKLNRLCRMKTEMGLRLLSLLVDNNVSVIATSETIPDLQTSSGEFHLTMLLAMSRYERRNISDNIKDAKRYMKQEGLKLSRSMTFGYDDAKRGEVSVNEIQKEIVVEIFNRFNNGQSIYSITDWLKQEHKDATKTGARWHRETVKSILGNPLYIGITKDGVKSKVYMPIIDEQLFFSVQNKRKAMKGVKVGKKEAIYLASGLLRCHCGARLQTIKEGNYRIFWCPEKPAEHRPPRMRVEEYDRWIKEEIATSEIKESINVNAKETIQIEKLETNLADTKKLLVDGTIDAKEFAEITKKIKANIETIKRNIKRESVKSNRKPFNGLNVVEQREHLSNLIKEVVAYPNGVICRFNDDVLPQHLPDDFSKAYWATKEIYYPYLLQRVKDNKQRLTLTPQNNKGFSGIKEYNLNGKMIWGIEWGEDVAEQDYHGWQPPKDKKECCLCKQVLPIKEFTVIHPTIRGKKQTKLSSCCVNCKRERNRIYAKKRK